MMFVRAAALIALAASVSAVTPVTIYNNCPFQVDPAFFPQVLLPSGVPTGGFPLDGKASTPVNFPSGYSGRAWGRTACTDAGVCTSGQCPTGGVNCTSPAPALSSPPGGPTLAQFTINGFSNLDFFNPSSNPGEGFNLPITISPGTGCSTTPKSCTNANNVGSGCGQTSTCPTGVSYTIKFC